MDKSYQSLTKRLGKVAFVVSIIALTLAVTVIILLNSLKISFFSISGESMAPTLENRDSVILKQHKEVEKDLIVFFNKPSAWTYTNVFGTEPKVLVKRISAVPGDTLSYDGEDFLINGESFFNLAENNYSCSDGELGYEHKLTNSEIFVTGDNHNFSLDSMRVFCDGKPDFYLPEPLVIDYGTIAFKF